MCRRITEGNEGNGASVSTQIKKQCPYFEQSIVTLPVPGKQTFLTLTVPICRLAETMSERLNTTPAGQEVLKLLTTTPLGGKARMMYGPDMQQMAAPICLVERLHARCEPEFVQTLTLFALEVTLPEVG